MRNINSKDLANVVNTNEYGASVNIFTAFYNNEKYCYRVYKDSFLDKSFIKRIGNLTEEEFSEEYLKPMYLVDKNRGNLSRYAENTQDLGFICDKNKLLRYLKISKVLLLNLHKEYKYIHGDISCSNILVNDDEVKTYICDFDTAIKIGQEPCDYTWFSDNLLSYLYYYKFDEKIDIYKFNLMTIAVLFNKYEHEVFNLIEQNKLGEFGEDKNVKRLAKELLLNDTRKSYSGEFIIDYIDDFKYRK